jgi:hypothetical protein
MCLIKGEFVGEKKFDDTITCSLIAALPHSSCNGFAATD